MTYESVDRLQNVLVKTVFHYTKDAKKAAGRALGTLVEIITFYLLKSWGFEHSVAIEKPLAEYGNPSITHNVEYSLHPILWEHEIVLHSPRFPITAARILAGMEEKYPPLESMERSSRTLLSTGGILRNSCVIGKRSASHFTATLDSATNQSELHVAIVEQFSKPYAIFECKRVGVEEGMRKGPQTIEKAKQGAYVAKSVSSLHKLRTASGELRGLSSGRNNWI